MKLRALLIKPNIVSRRGFDMLNKMTPPLGLGYIASALLAAGHEVKILDMVAEGAGRMWDYGASHTCHGLTDDDLLDVCRAFAPDVVGVTGFTTQHSRIVEIISAVKIALPGVITVLGGVHVTSIPEMVMECSGADYALLGDAEESIVGLFEAVSPGNAQALERIGGLARRVDGGIAVNPLNARGLDIGGIRPPARQLLPNEAYIRHGIPMPVITSRGCPYSCAFCCVHVSRGRSYYYRDPASVVDEIESVVRDYGYGTVSIFDDAFNVIPERVIAICKEIKNRRLGIRLVLPSSLIISRLTRETLFWLKEAGCVSVALPFEHVDEKIRNSVINKNLPSSRFEEVLEWCRDVGLLAVVNFVLGMPGETEETLRAIVDYVGKNAFRMDGVASYIATPFPGTPFYRECEEKGYLDRAAPFLEYDLYGSVIDTPWITGRVVEKYKTEIDSAFKRAREGLFDENIVRRAIRKSDKEAMAYVNSYYFEKRNQEWDKRAEIR
ncbi:MAG: B12-binding domain-containing radical SAM protein [Nitrospinae bacterium]|nr:B12-binding domain-containing radical SAM protein [Nitrospinota bacterium]